VTLKLQTKHFEMNDHTRFFFNIKQLLKHYLFHLQILSKSCRQKRKPHYLMVRNEPPLLLLCCLLLILSNLDQYYYYFIGFSL